MEVSPSRLREAGHQLRDASTGLDAPHPPPDDGWAWQAALVGTAAAWDGYLAALAARLAATGDALLLAAANYGDADARAAQRSVPL
jgi:hypothetical protein